MHAVVPVQSHRGNHRGGAPMPVRSMADQSFASGRTIAQVRHVRLGGRLVDEDQPGRCRRALAMSGRFCSAALCIFLIIYSQLGEHLMNRGDRASQTQALFDLRQGQIGLFRPQRIQLPAPLRQQPRLPPKKRCLGSICPVRRRCCNSFLTIPADTRKRFSTFACVHRP